MKKLICLLLMLVVAEVLYAGLRARYFAISGELPAGTTVQINISGTRVFTVGGSTHTKYVYNYVIPFNSREIFNIPLSTPTGHDFNIPLSTQTFHLIIHGDVR